VTHSSTEGHVPVFLWSSQDKNDTKGFYSFQLHYKTSFTCTRSTFLFFRLVLEPGLGGVGEAADHESSELLKDPPLPGVASILGDGDLKYIVEYEPSFKLCCTDLGVNKGIFNAPVLSHTAVLDSVDQRFRNSFDK